jgi:hypothetical protein
MEEQHQNDGDAAQRLQLGQVGRCHRDANGTAVRFI